MDLPITTAVTSRAGHLERELSIDEMRRRAPAVFASSAHQRMGHTYTFISTEKILRAFQGAGFVPVEVRQTISRRANLGYARHLVRLRRRFETLDLRDSTPEIVMLNSHNGSSAYQLRFGLFRFVCANGLILTAGECAAMRVPHRGDVVDELIIGALRMAERFGEVGDTIERMRSRVLEQDRRIAFAEAALKLRYPEDAAGAVTPSRLLRLRRVEDNGSDLWRTYNVVQENLLGGGVERRSASGRLTRTRRITSITEDVRVNGGLWDLAVQALAA